MYVTLCRNGQLVCDLWCAPCHGALLPSVSLPHWTQNAAAAGSFLPQCLHVELVTCGSRLPQALQNLLLGGFRDPHEQTAWPTAFVPSEAAEPCLGSIALPQYTQNPVPG